MAPQEEIFSQVPVDHQTTLEPLVSSDNSFVQWHVEHDIHGLPDTPLSTNSIFDVVIAGFGPSALSFAIAIYDTMESSDGKKLFKLPRKPNIAFLEKQRHFAWHEGMLLDGARMQISFIKDLATLRNPRSRFTFLNYLWEKDRLVQFSNLNTFLPTRVEFEDYLCWCAQKFENVVHYGREVVDITPQIDGNLVNHFLVRSTHVDTSEEVLLKTRHVIIAVGGAPKIPPPFQHLLHNSLHLNGQEFSKKPIIIHSSQYTHFLSPSSASSQPPLNSARRIAVIGSGQSAAEIFTNIASHLPGNNNGPTELHLLFRGPSLRPADDSPFVNELFDPARVEPFYAASAESRREHIDTHRNTNYSVVREELLEKMYEMLYMQRVQDDIMKMGRSSGKSASKKLTLRILPGAEVKNATLKETGTVHLEIEWTPVAGLSESILNGANSDPNLDRHEGLEYDIVILATGYSHNGFEKMLSPVHQAARFAMISEKSEAGRAGRFSVERDYRLSVVGLRFSKNTGIWLQGCNEETHGLSDTLLSGLAVRGGQLVQSIFNEQYFPNGDEANDANDQSNQIKC